MDNESRAAVLFPTALGLVTNHRPGNPEQGRAPRRVSCARAVLRLGGAVAWLFVLTCVLLCSPTARAALDPSQAKRLANEALFAIEPGAVPVAVTPFRDAAGAVSAYVVEFERTKDRAPLHVVVSARPTEAPIQRIQQGIPWHRDPGFLAALPGGPKSVDRLAWEGTYEVYAPVPGAGHWVELFSRYPATDSQVREARERRAADHLLVGAGDTAKIAKQSRIREQWSAAETLLHREAANLPLPVSTATPAYGFTGWVRNVPYLFQGSSPDCGIVSMMNILLYHDANGHPALVDEANLNGLRLQLRQLMNWTSNGTYSHDQLNGTSNYIASRGAGRFTLSMNSKRNYTGVTSLNMAFSQFTSEIDANRPVQMMIYNYTRTNPTWDTPFPGSGHAVTGVGYYRGTLFGQASAEWAIIHDNWKGSFTNPYQANVEPPYVDYSVIETFIKVVPPATSETTSTAVFFVSPTSGSQLPAGSVTLIAQATPGQGRSITSVAFSRNGATIGSATHLGNNRYQVVAAGLPAGPSTITVTVTDSSASTATASTSITLASDNTPPTVGWYAPQYENTEVYQGQPLLLSAVATDVDGGISQVEFLIGSTVVATGVTGGTGNNLYTASWTPTSLGQTTLTARATDSGGATSTSTRTVRVSPVTTAGNDAFSAASPIAGAGGLATASSLAATKETGEPDHGGNVGGKSLWWRWTAATTGTVTVTTLGSNFDTLLSVYTGNALDSLVSIASNDDADAGLQSRVTFTSQSGTTYRIAVDGYAGASGAINLNLTPTAPTTENTAVFSATGLPKSIPDNDSIGISCPLTVTGANRIVSARISYSIAHTYIGDLQVTLRSPNGTEVVLHANTGGSNDNITITGSSLSAVVGEQANGIWTLRIRDLANLDVGQLTAFSLELTTTTGGGGATSDVQATGLPRDIPDNDATGIEIPLPVTGLSLVTTLSLSIEIDHTYRGDLRVELVAPNGTSEMMQDLTGGSATDLDLVRQPTTRFTGAAATGTWRIRVWDLLASDTGSVRSATLHFGGTPAAPSPALDYLGDLSDLAGGFSSSYWLGTVYTASFPWIYHVDHGWLYAAGTGGNTIFLFDHAAQEWIFTSPSLYPRFYSFGTRSWYYYQPDTNDPRRVYNFSTLRWETRP